MSTSPAMGPTALVHDWLTGMRGGENVLAAIGSLFPEAPIYTLLHVPGSVEATIEAHPIITSFLGRAPGIARHYRRYLPLFPAAIEDLDLAGYELVVSSSHCVAKGVIPDPGSYHICYCHTPMRYAWDQEHAYFPRRRGIGARIRGLALSALRTWDVASAARVDLFVANSRFVAQRIRRYYGREAEVLPPPVDTDFFTLPGPGEVPPEDLPAPAGEYCLAVSALAPYKRLDLAIAACRQLDLPLVVVGTGPEWSRLRQLAGPRTHWLGRVDRERLRTLFQNALCLLQPGTEDFGIAPVEALACGTPVVALGRGGVLDIVEDGVHGVLYRHEPGRQDGEVEALSEAIDRRRQMRFNILDLRDQANSFSVTSFLDRFRFLVEQRPDGHGGVRP